MRPETIDGNRAAAIARSIRVAAEDLDLYKNGMPDPGWHRSTIDPATVVDAAEGVSLRDGWSIDCYQFNDGLNRWPHTIAVPRDDSVDTLTLGGDGEFERPAGAVVPSTVLIPEGSPESFFARSWLLRELLQLGAVWHAVWWGTHTPLIGSGPVPKDETWTWTEPPPANFDTTVEFLDTGAAKVTFFTASLRRPARVVRHRDTHRVRDGLIEFSETDLATSRGGYMV